MNEELTNIELSPDNVISYLITTKGYMEEDDDVVSALFSTGRRSTFTLLS